MNDPFHDLDRIVRESRTPLYSLGVVHDDKNKKSDKYEIVGSNDIPGVVVNSHNAVQYNSNLVDNDGRNNHDANVVEWSSQSQRRQSFVELPAVEDEYAHRMRATVGNAAFVGDASESDDDSDGVVGTQLVVPTNDTGRASGQHATLTAQIPHEALEGVRRRMRQKIEKYKTQVQRLKRQHQQTSEENNRLRVLVDEFGREKMELNRDLFLRDAVIKEKRRAYNNGGNGSDGHNGDTLSSKQRQQRIALLEGIEALAKEQDDDDDDDEFTQGTATDSIQSRLHHHLHTIKNWIVQHFPFSRDIDQLRSRYGSGIAQYFAFYRFIVLNSLFFLVLWGYAFSRQWWLYSGSYADSQGALPIWTFFSQWTGGGWWYVFGICCCILFLYIVSLWKWVTDHREVERSKLATQGQQRVSFSVLALNAWDFSLNKERSVQYFQKSIVSRCRALLEEQDVRNRVERRTRSEHWILIGRRVIGLLLNLGFVFASWVAIIVITFNQTKISDYFRSKNSGMQFFADFAAPMTTSIINTALPLITIAITEFEKWDSEVTRLKHRMWRMYSGRQLNLFINLVTYYSIAQGTSFTDRIRSSYDQEVYKCGEDAAGAGLFSLVVAEFFISKMVEFGMYYTKELMRRTVMPTITHTEFLVSEGVMNLLYFQSLVWCSLPLYPFGTILSAVFLCVNFKFEQLMITKLRKKPTHVWNAKDTAIFFTVFYNVTLVCAFASYYYFMTASWDCDSQGPFKNTPEYVPWNEVSLYMGDTLNISWLYEILSAPVLYITFGTAFLLKFLFKRNQYQCLRQYYSWKDVAHWKEVTALNRIIEQNERILGLHKRADQQQ